MRTRSEDDEGESKARRSDCREERREEVLVPRRRRMRLGFSWGRGARRERARAERAFLGFLEGKGIVLVLFGLRRRNLCLGITKVTKGTRTFLEGL